MNHYGMAITSQRFPYLPIRVDVRGIVYEGYALLDTGFDGGVILPSRYLPPSHAAEWTDSWALADGSSVIAPAYSGTVEINGFRQFDTFITALGDEALIGVHAIRRFTVILDHGQRVVVEA